MWTAGAYNTKTFPSSLNATIKSSSTSAICFTKVTVIEAIRVFDTADLKKQTNHTRMFCSQKSLHLLLLKWFLPNMKPIKKENRNR